MSGGLRMRTGRRTKRCTSLLSANRVSTHAEITSVQKKYNEREVICISWPIVWRVHAA